MADYDDHRADFDALGAAVIAGSSDPLEDARARADETGFRSPMLFGLDAGALADALGVYTGVRQGRPHLQPAAFVLEPDGTVAHAVYSSGKVGRLTAGDALTVLRGMVKRD